MSDFLAVVMIALIRFYRWIRPSGLPICRYEPSCSLYAWQSILIYGPYVGGWKSLCRICRCHPLRPGGWDPV
jgi:hypothetical protein